MVAGEIKVAGAAGNADALFDAVEEFILPQFLSHLAVQGMHTVRQAVEFIEKLAQSRPVNARGVLQRRQGTHLPFKFLHDLGLEVGAVEDIEDVEKAGQRIAAVPLGWAFETRGEFIE